MIYIPLIGALLEAAGTIIEKKILKNKKINYKNYTPYGFLAIVLVMLPFTYFLWHLEPQAMQLNNLLIFLAVVIISVLANILMCYSIKRETVTEIEPIKLMQPLFIVLIAFTLSFFIPIYAKEGKVSILILAIIASISLILSHVKKHHLVYDKYIIAALIGSFLFALELVISRLILDYYSSFTFYFLRCLLIFIITLVIFRPKGTGISNKIKIQMVTVAIIWVIYRLILYYGYVTYGIVFTTILFILAPIFIYLFARIFLKEKITWKQILSSIVIIICIAIAILLQNK